MEKVFREQLGQEIVYIQRNCPSYMQNLKTIRSAEMEKLLGANSVEDLKFTQGTVHALDILIRLLYMPD